MILQNVVLPKDAIQGPRNGGVVFDFAFVSIVVAVDVTVVAVVFVVMVEVCNDERFFWVIYTIRCYSHVLW